MPWFVCSGYPKMPMQVVFTKDKPTARRMYAEKFSGYYPDWIIWLPDVKMAAEVKRMADHNWNGTEDEFIAVFNP